MGLVRAFAWVLTSAALGLALGAAPLSAQGTPVLLRDSFPIGSAKGILCQVQDRSVGNPVRKTIFDRRWAVVCRDSARPVATIYAFREGSHDFAALTASDRRDAIDCAEATTGAASGVSGAQRTLCHVAGTKLGWSMFALNRGGTTWRAEGLAAYDSATQLALRSVLDDAIADGTIDVATTSIADPVAFARVQAITLEPRQALAEGYRRNLGGDYAEAAAYFETLQERLGGDSAEEGINPGEFAVNRALQKSNLGQFAEADRLFTQAAPLTAGDPVAERLQRNFEAINLINQGYVDDAIARLDRPLSAGLAGAAVQGDKLEITAPLAAQLNGGTGQTALLGFRDDLKLSPAERAAIIDAQALQLRGTALRIKGEDAGARSALLDSYSRAIAVRGGRVTSITRLRAQILSELAAISDKEGDQAKAEGYLRNALSLLENEYPEHRAVGAARARLAALLLRTGRTDEAVKLYGAVIDGAIGERNAAVGFANQLAPYFAWLAPRVEADPAAAEGFFKATQILIRPGVAETQAVLARELSAQSDEASRLFRQSTDLARDIERARIRYQMLGASDQTGEVVQARTELAAQVDALEQEQQRTQAQLNDYPQYRVVAPRALTLEQFRAAMKPGEAYARIALVAGRPYMFWADRDHAKAWAIDTSADDLDYEVDMLRASISTQEGGQYVTYPYEIGIARKLYTQLFGPVAGQLAQTTHLIFEPDGALLRLPVDILVADDASVDRYNSRIAAGGDAFDFTGTGWLGRTTEVSTAVSAQSFVDARNAPRSRATHEYLGLGQNAPLGSNPPPAVRATLVSGSNACGWSVAEWNHPIADTELRTAESVIGDAGSQLMTGQSFTDQAIIARSDLDQFRIVHFATHGLVTPPAPPCPARPALLTSFGSSGSDGLLSFDEIYRLKLDADVVILSACDTAGAASIEATREAGIGTGGGTALDGLVRAFIGAGGRAVLASHWPAPDEYAATQHLIDAMFELGRSEDLGAALRDSRIRLMDDPKTSHPYYWGGFALIGDGAQPLLSDTVHTAAAGAGAAVLRR
jgi:CHAT domain-containing protein